MTNSVNPQAIPTCISPTNEANPYSFYPRVSAVDIYAEYYNHYYDNSLLRDTARQKAFMLLGKYTEHWSYFVDISVDDTPLIRITMTYFHPVLVHHIVLNNTFSNNSYLSDFDAQLWSVMNKLAQRNVLLFGVTITAPAYNPQASNINSLTVQLPIRQMALVNSTGMYIYPIHVDPVLTEYITITREPVFGFVSYPISVAYQENNCTWIMDSPNTTLVLEIPSVNVGATQIPTQFWSIPYRSSIFNDLELPVLSVNPSAYVYENNYDWGRVSRLSMPPIPNWQPDIGFDNMNWKTYWEEMGRFLWYQLLPENEP